MEEAYEKHFFINKVKEHADFKPLKRNPTFSGSCCPSADVYLANLALLYFYDDNARFETHSADVA